VLRAIVYSHVPSAARPSYSGSARHNFTNTSCVSSSPLDFDPHILVHSEKTRFTCDRYNLSNARFRTDELPLDESCGCRVCQRWSRAYLRHLLSVQEPTGARLVSLHNLEWLVRFVAAMRTAVVDGRFAAFRAATLAIWA